MNPRPERRAAAGGLRGIGRALAHCVLAAFGFWHALPRIRQAARPVYVRLGILPPPTEQNV